MASQNNEDFSKRMYNQGSYNGSTWNHSTQQNNSTQQYNDNQQYNNNQQYNSTPQYNGTQQYNSTPQNINNQQYHNNQQYSGNPQCADGNGQYGSNHTGLYGNSASYGHSNGYNNKYYNSNAVNGSNCSGNSHNNNFLCTDKITNNTVVNYYNNSLNSSNLSGNSDKSQYFPHDYNNSHNTGDSKMLKQCWSSPFAEAEQAAIWRNYMQKSGQYNADEKTRWEDTYRKWEQFHKQSLFGKSYATFGAPHPGFPHPGFPNQGFPNPGFMQSGFPGYSQQVLKSNSPGKDLSMISKSGLENAGSKQALGSPSGGYPLPQVSSSSGVTSGVISGVTPAMPQLHQAATQVAQQDPNGGVTQSHNAPLAPSSGLSGSASGLATLFSDLSARVKDRERRTSSPLPDFPNILDDKPSVSDSEESSSPQSKKTKTFSGDPMENGIKKPPYSYVALICMCIAEHPKHKCTLKEIIEYIEERYPYYRQHKKWYGSIRHNLTLNDCFIKEQRRPGDKSRPWALDPNYKDMFDNGSLLRRRYRFKDKTKKKKYQSKKKQSAPMQESQIVVSGGGFEGSAHPGVQGLQGSSPDSLTRVMGPGMVHPLQIDSHGQLPDIQMAGSNSNPHDMLQNGCSNSYQNIQGQSLPNLQVMQGQNFSQNMVQNGDTPTHQVPVVQGQGSSGFPTTQYQNCSSLNVMQNGEGANFDGSQKLVF